MTHYKDNLNYEAVDSGNSNKSTSNDGNLLTGVLQSRQAHAGVHMLTKLFTKVLEVLSASPSGRALSHGGCHGASALMGDSAHVRVPCALF